MTAVAPGAALPLEPTPARRAPLVLGGAALVAWLGLVAWGRSPAAPYLDHDGLAHPDALRVGLLATAWMLMALAMMVPPSLRYVGRLGASRAARTATWTAAFVAVWLVFGVTLTAFDVGVHRAVDAVPWLDAHDWLVLPVTLLAAAAYQLTRLKRMSLEACREPSRQRVRAWATAGGTRAWRLGARHGLDCVGSCGALMVVVFALGMADLPAMTVATAVMTGERVLGQRSVPWLAAALAVAAVFARASG